MQIFKFYVFTKKPFWQSWRIAWFDFFPFTIWTLFDEVFYFLFFFEICMYGRISLDFKWKTTKSRNGLTIMKKEKKKPAWTKGDASILSNRFVHWVHRWTMKKKLMEIYVNPWAPTLWLWSKFVPSYSTTSTKNMGPPPSWCSWQWQITFVTLCCHLLKIWLIRNPKYLVV